MGSGGPYEIHVTSQKYGKISLVDVMFGDVWVCSGQSNMAFSLAHVSSSYLYIYFTGPIITSYCTGI